MRDYVGMEVVQAEPMTLGEYKKKYEDADISWSKGKDFAGYRVTYESHTCWKPKLIFEKKFYKVC